MTCDADVLALSRTHARRLVAVASGVVSAVDLGALPHSEAVVVLKECMQQSQQLASQEGGASSVAGVTGLLTDCDILLRTPDGRNRLHGRLESAWSRLGPSEGFGCLH